MKVTFIGALHEVTGSCTLLECGHNKVLVDYGMEQGLNVFENVELPVSPQDLCDGGDLQPVQHHAFGQRAYPGIRRGVEEP